MHGLTEKGNILQNSLGKAVFTTEALVKERVIQKVHAPASVQCNQCNYKAKTRWLLKQHINFKHRGIPRPENRGRKRKVGTVTKRTLYRRGLNNSRNITAREISWLAKEVPMSERNLEKVLKFQKTMAR